MFALLFDTAEAGSWRHQFDNTIAQVEQMVWNQSVQSMAARHGLNVVNVTWEDTGRSKGSSMGPNISDMTIGVRDARGALHPMPVFRFDNFTDKTADVRSDEFWLKVGNERNRSLRPVSIADILQHPRSYLHDASSWTGNRSSLWSSRDDYVLVSAQACFLPIPLSGSATFTPVLYNYQSYPGNPADLAIIATREGTSMQVIENEGGYLSEALYFNDNGERAPFTAERLSDWRDDVGYNGPISEDSGLSVVLLVQVPLKQKPRPTYYGYDGYGNGTGGAAEMAAPSSATKSSDVEQAVVSHGPVEGPFTEFHDLPIERDTRFPVRVTVQFYKATSNGVVTDADVAAIRRQIDRVYAKGDWVGSLVTEGITGRPTETNYHPRPVVQSDNGNARWADSFWDWHKGW